MITRKTKEQEKVKGHKALTPRVTPGSYRGPSKRGIEAGAVTILDYLTTSEVAKRLGLSADGVRYHARLGHLSAVRVGRDVRLFPRDEVERFAASRQVRPDRSNYR